MSATPRGPGDPSLSDELRAAHRHFSNINGMVFDPELATLLLTTIETTDALVEALSRFCTNDWADEFRANGYGNCAGCGVGVDDIHVDAEHPSVDHGPRCAVLQGRAALRQAGALE